jgi:hypothetical protein
MLGTAPQSSCVSFRFTGFLVLASATACHSLLGLDGYTIGESPATPDAGELDAGPMRDAAAMLGVDVAPSREDAASGGAASGCDRSTGGQDACVDLSDVCAGKVSGYVCDGQIRMTCGPASDAANASCGRNAHCEQTNAATCACNPGYAASGAKDCVDIDECSAPDSCSGRDSYPCVQTVAPGYVCQGQFADWHMPDHSDAAKFMPSYDVSTPGVVLDNVTGLMWQQQAYLGPQDLGLSWTAAKNVCGDLTLAEKGNWRLPTKIELESIVDADWAATDRPMRTYFWSSSSHADQSMNLAWFVIFPTGHSDYQDRGVLSAVRCVRSPDAQLESGNPADRYISDTTAGTITDTRTDLVWELSHSPRYNSNSEAKMYCAGHPPTGWRLPARNELLTLIDPTRLMPSIDPIFSATPSDNFWSSTPVEGSPGDEWYVSFVAGRALETEGGTAAISAFARCVR